MTRCGPPSWALLRAPKDSWRSRKIGRRRVSDGRGLTLVGTAVGNRKRPGGGFHRGRQSLRSRLHQNLVCTAAGNRRSTGGEFSPAMVASPANGFWLLALFWHQNATRPGSINDMAYVGVLGISSSTLDAALSLARVRMRAPIEICNKGSRFKN